MARKLKTKIPYLLSSSGNHKITNPQDIANEFSKFYYKLYNLKKDPRTISSSPNGIESVLQTINLLSLTDCQLAELNLPFSEEVIAQIIKTLPIGKSPGSDGNSNGYYRAFLAILSPYLCKPSSFQLYAM